MTAKQFRFHILVEIDVTFAFLPFGQSHSNGEDCDRDGDSDKQCFRHGVELSANYSGLQKIMSNINLIADI